MLKSHKGLNKRKIAGSNLWILGESQEIAYPTGDVIVFIQMHTLWMDIFKPLNTTPTSVI